jgi:hypothetical protein
MEGKLLDLRGEGWPRGVVEGRGQWRVKDNVRQREKRGWDEIAFRLGIKLRRGIRGAPGVLPTLGALNSEGERRGGNAWKDCKGGYRVLSIGIDIALISIAHGEWVSRQR